MFLTAMMVLILVAYGIGSAIYVTAVLIAIFTSGKKNKKNKH